MIRFSLFGIPVEIQPFFWVVTALLGGAINADSREDFLAVTLFMMAAFVSILIHELGHALTGRKLGGGYSSILLHSMGGLAMNQGGRLTRHQRFLMIAAGPGAGFAFLLVILALLSTLFGIQNVIAFAGGKLFNLRLQFSDYALIDFFRAKPFIYELVAQLIWINFWWGIINLLPVMPLDGGQITNLYVRPQHRVHFIGMIAAGTMAVFGLLKLNSPYMAILFGYFAWQNYQEMKANGG